MQRLSAFPLLFLILCACAPSTPTLAPATPTVTAVPTSTPPPTPTIIPSPVPDTLFVDPFVSLGPISPLVYG